MVHIDYTTIPETYSVKPVANWSDPSPGRAMTAIVEKAKMNLGTYVLIDFITSRGATHMPNLNVHAGNLWEGELDLEGSREFMEAEGE
jgi:hypothetical protein